MIFMLLADPPFVSEVEISSHGYFTTRCRRNIETDIKKVGNTILITWIRLDTVHYSYTNPNKYAYNANYLALSFDERNSFLLGRRTCNCYSTR